MKPIGYQKPPRGTQIRPFAKVGERESDDHTCRDVDDQSAIRKPGSHAAGDRGPDPVPQESNRVRRPQQSTDISAMPFSLNKSVPRSAPACAQSAEIANATQQSRHRFCSRCIQGSRRDMTPQQDSLSGVIICPANRKGQRLRVNSFTTALITTRHERVCQRATSRPDNSHNFRLREESESAVVSL